MKKISVLFLLLFTFFSVQSQTKYETEKWLAEKLFAYSYVTPLSEMQVEEVDVCNCEILVKIDVWVENQRYHGLETIPISSVLLYTKWYMGIDDVYQFRGNIKWTWRPASEYNCSTSNFLLKDVPDDMLERIQKALEYYRKLCGVNEPF